MAADENCTISLMDGDDLGSGGSSLCVGRMEDAALQDFVRAKDKINEIFVEIEDYVRDTVTCMQSAQQDGIIVTSDDAVQVEGHIENVKTTQNMLTRIHMKVAFFGRTSSGKSSVINAMLREKILPSAYGHTTNCFVQLQGSDSGEPYLVTEGSTERQNVESVGQLANALSNKRLEKNQLLHIYWPKEKCMLLRDDVVFVDCPGFAISPKFNELINRYCVDADVFVFVANAQSTLMHEEKNFFHEVSKRVAKPNIFILNNHWDIVASDPDDLDQVRAQHMEGEVEFLVTELNVCTQEEANQRIFFVSAKEALQARLQEQKGLPAHSGPLADGVQKRYSVFQDFEQKFQKCISKSAVRTKFEQHFQRGKLIVSEIQQIIDSICDQAQQMKTQKAEAKAKIQVKLKNTEQQRKLLTEKMKDKIRQMVEDVKRKVSKALRAETRCLSVLVHEFDFPFRSEQHHLNLYKQKLLHHIEKRLVGKLRAGLLAKLATDIENIQREMTEQMSCLVPAEKKNDLPQQERFEIRYRLNCDNLWADFREDLDFEFSMSAGKCVSTISGAGTTGAVVAGKLTKNVVLTVAAGVAGATIATVGVCAIYISERVNWDDEAKEKQFKQQFVAHVTKEERLSFDSISANCSKQVEQELSSTFAQLCDLVNGAIDDMDAEIKTLDEEIKQLEEAANSAKVLQNKANYITEQLEVFYDAFLKLHN